MFFFFKFSREIKVAKIKTVAFSRIFNYYSVSVCSLSNGKRKSIFGLSRTPLSDIKKPKVTLSKFDLLLEDKKPKKEETTDDSDYEVEEVYELREWYPPDFWRSKDQDKNDRVCQTDVTADNLTVTMLESRVSDGFFKAL